MLKGLSHGGIPLNSMKDGASGVPRPILVQAGGKGAGTGLCDG
jgi:hypothetical protein